MLLQKMLLINYVVPIFIKQQYLRMIISTIKKNPFIKGWIFVALLFVFSAFLTPARKIHLPDAETSLKIAQQDNNLLVTIKVAGNTGVQLYMFTVDGRLLKEYDINGSKKFVIQNLQKGIYLYEFFNNDQHLKTGKIELK